MYISQLLGLLGCVNVPTTFMMSVGEFLSTWSPGLV
ncbi:hypothetical protein ABIA38_002977 [Embleya sp. AB8]